MSREWDGSLTCIINTKENDLGVSYLLWSFWTIVTVGVVDVATTMARCVPFLVYNPVCLVAAQ